MTAAELCLASDWQLSFLSSVLGPPGPPGVQGTHTTSPSVLTAAPAGLAGGGAAEGRQGQRRGLGQGVSRMGCCGFTGDAGRL